MKKIVMIPETLDGRKKTWRKHLGSVDKTKANGYAFVGNWLQAGERAELEVGSFILCYDELGFYWKGGYGERSWALAVRDEIAAILDVQGQESSEEESPLANIPDEELIAELERRGYAVTKIEREE